ncbi:MAG: glycosyltransferase [Vulcanimicrobiaceae bacterium]
MKRVLLIAHIFPPETGAGALRPGHLAKYLPDFDWEATVLTRTTAEPSFPVRIVTAGEIGASMQNRVRASFDNAGAGEYSPFRSALRAAKEFMLFPDRQATWVPRALERASQLLRDEQFDAILGTALPASVHVIGGLLARRSKIPWIADYRDPWAGNAYVVKGPLRKALEETAERNLLSRAAAITTISEPIASVLRDFHRRDDIHVIPNAYDPSDWDSLCGISPRRFELCYTGSMYEGKRSPDLLFEALRDLRAAGDPAGEAARVLFYGPNSSNVDTSAQRFNVTAIVERHGTVPRADAMRAQRSAAMLLIFLNMDPATAGEMGSKFLEYVGARRPILAFGPKESVMREFIARHALGWFASTVDEATTALRAAYARFLNGDAELRTDSNTFPTARDLAERFASVLDEFVAYRETA